MRVHFALKAEQCECMYICICKLSHLHVAERNNCRKLEWGRYNLMARSGLWRCLENAGARWGFAEISVRFRRELRPFQTFRVFTRIAGFNDRDLFIEQKIVTCGYLSGLFGGEEFVNAHSVSALRLARRQPERAQGVTMGEFVHRLIRAYATAQHASQAATIDSSFSRVWSSGEGASAVSLVSPPGVARSSTEEMLVSAFERLGDASSKHLKKST